MKPRYLTLVYRVTSESQQKKLLATEWASVSHGHAPDKIIMLGRDMEVLNQQLSDRQTEIRQLKKWLSDPFGGEDALRAEIDKLRAENEALKAIKHDEDLLEQLYWDFDHERNKHGDERMKFKGKLRFYAQHVAPQPVRQPLTCSRIRELLLSCGYKIKPDSTDLAPYVYIAARAIERAHGIG